MDLSCCPPSSIKIVQRMIDNGELNDLKKLFPSRSLTKNAETNASLLSSLAEVVSKQHLHFEELDVSETCSNARGAAALGNLMSNVDCHEGRTGILDPSAYLWGKDGYCIHLDNT